MRVCTHIESQSVCTCPVNEYFDCVCVCVCVQFIVKQSRRLTALVEFVAANFVVVITIVYELHAQQHSLSAPIAVIHYTNFVNDNGYCCCWRSNTFTDRERESEKCRRTYAYMYICMLTCITLCISCSCSPSLFLSLRHPSFCPASRQHFQTQKLRTFSITTHVQNNSTSSFYHLACSYHICFRSNWQLSNGQKLLWQHVREADKLSV